jgi:PAT family beta-lactamase induction signal transducer AmpG
MKGPITSAGCRPALSENALLRYTTFVALYFAQGVPEGITLFGIPAWMAMNGKTPAEIASYSAVALLPTSLKILLAPMVERFTYLPMGRRRPWLLIGQSGLVLSFIGLAFVPDPLHHLPLLTAAVVCVHTFDMLQDIATDSLVIDIVPLDQQGRANSLMWGAKSVGTAASLAVGSWLINQYGFTVAILATSTIIGLILLAPLLLRERPGEKLLPWTQGVVSPDTARLQTQSWGALLQAARRVFALRNSLLLLLVVFTSLLSLNYLRTSFPIFTIQQLGWTNVRYSQVYSTSGLIGGIVGMIVGGLLISRLGTIRLVQAGLLAVGLLAATAGVSRALWPNATFITGFIGGFSLLYTLIVIGLLALAMQCCWKRISALQFTFYMTIFNSGQAVGAALLGYVRSHYPWEVTFLVFPLLTVLAIGLLQQLHLPAHAQQLAELENTSLGAGATAYAW